MTDPATLREVYAEIAATKLWSAGWIAYEAAPYLNPALHPVERDLPDDFVYMEFAQFGRESGYHQIEPSRLEFSSPELRYEWSAEEYEARFDQVQEYLREGRNYQTNLTFESRFSSELDAADLFSHWCGMEPPRHAQICRLGTDVVSLSPELFFRAHPGYVGCLPMKGTLPINQPKKLLLKDAKNRAENLMIVDMVRNDLSQLMGANSVRTRLFDVLPFRNVWQMVSSVSCRTSEYPEDVLPKLFPAASITGAPKAETMRIINELESSPRGPYCGALGVLGDLISAEFSVPIRTAVKQGDEWVFRIGSGIVLDSDARSEYEECLLKAQVTKTRGARWGLVETFLVGPDGVELIEGHMSRLKRSALHFGMGVPEGEIRQAISGLRPGVHRLVLDPSGIFTIGPKADVPRTARVRRRPLCFGGGGTVEHKTTDRSSYDWDQEERLIAGELLAEFTTGNIVLQLDGELYTPPFQGQLLPGVARAHWLATGKLKERVLTLADLDRAEAVFHLNAARGLRPVEFVD